MEWTLLQGLPPEDVRRLLSIARRRTFRKGEVVFHRDDLAESLHLIAKGRFAVRITTQLGETALLDVIGPGEAFGELALLSPGSRRSATVESLDEGETLSVLREDFALLQAEHPGVKDVLLRLLAEQLTRASDRIVEAHYTDAETRVRRRLRDLALRQGADGTKTDISMTQEHLAEMAGTSRATVNRVLREEERRGAVALTRGHTTVLDLDDLSSRCK
jgi:CRP/FNR family transcriptional regulator, cyclic AMP receptor protein